jgi:hypothetical protein
LVAVSRRLSSGDEVSLPGAFDAEGGEGAGFGLIEVMFDDVVDAGSARTAAHGGAKLGEIVRSARCHDFDLAILCITDPSMEMEFGGLALDKPAESDALNTAAN